jgi:hypothetical protein
VASKGVAQPDRIVASYRMSFDRYVPATQKNAKRQQTGRSSGHRRTLITPTHLQRTVVRPFDETISGRETRSLGFVRDSPSSKARVVLVRPLPDDPLFRPGDLTPTNTAKSVERMIAGRRCATVGRGGVQYCVDADGLALVRITADSVDIATRVTVLHDAKSAEQLAADLAKGFVDADRGSIRPLDPDSAPPGTDWSLDAPPDGFGLVGRYAVVPLTSKVLARNSRQVIAAIVDVYVNGPDAVVVERGGRLDTSDVDDGDLGSLTAPHEVDLGDVGMGTIGVGGEGPYGYREVRAIPSKGRYVVIAGTIDEDALIALGRSLHSWPGTNLRYLDGRATTPPPPA